jgi:hypothetical protein
MAGGVEIFEWWWWMLAAILLPRNAVLAAL